MPAGKPASDRKGSASLAQICAILRQTRPGGAVMGWAPADTLASGSVAIRSRLCGIQGLPLMLWSEGSCEGRRSGSGSIGTDPGLRARKAMALPIEDYALIGDCKT